MDRQMKGDEDRSIIRRQILVEIDPVQMDKVGIELFHRPRQQPPERSVRFSPSLRSDDSIRQRRSDQSPADSRFLRSDNDRLKATLHKSLIQMKQDLLGAADGAGAHRRKRIGDT